MTSPEHWRALKALFQQALELPPEQRAGFVQATPPELRAQLARLLDADAHASGFLDPPPAGAPAEIGPYRIVREIGRGGMGTVYLAEDSRLARRVALKILPPAFASDPERLSRFEREARTASALNHPNIVTVFEVGHEHGVPYIATELVDGETLRQRLQRGAIAAREAVEIALQAVAALEAAHAGGIVHRDIKPENIMLRGDGYVKVLDFGIAKVRGAPTAETQTLLETVPGAVMGTLAYMAPEQAGGLEVDARADIYSLGVVMREMHPALERIAARATRPHPAERYQTAAELRRGLLRLRNRRTRYALALAVVLLAFAAGAAFFALRRPTPDRFELTRITGMGKVEDVAVSRDGRYLAYVENGLHLRQLATGSEVRLAPAEAHPRMPVFSPDGSYVYYRAGIFRADLYRIPTIGGRAQLLQDGKQGNQISFAPNGKHFAAGFANALVIADPEGRVQRTLVSTKPQGELGAVAWSPDGKVIATWLEGALVTIPAGGGTPKPLSARKWNDVGSMVWQDDANLLITGADAGAFWFQPVWRVSYPAGDVRRVTTDLSSYQSLSLAPGRIVAVQFTTNVTVTLWPGGGSFSVPAAGDFFDLCWTPDGRLLYSSDATGSLDLWMADPDGGNRRQLTRDAGANGVAAVCGDGRHIVFVSNRTGEFRIWRMDSDGGNPAALTGKVEELETDCSPDGRWVAYHDSGLWRVPIEGGKPVRISVERLTAPAFSPDGRWIAAEAGKHVQVAPAAGGSARYTLRDVPHFLTRLRWAPDSRGIDYVDKAAVWRRPLDGRPPRQIAAFGTGDLCAFAWSRDGKRLAAARAVQSSDVVAITGAGR